jgi:translocation and assembly module TamA
MTTEWTTLATHLVTQIWTSLFNGRLLLVASLFVFCASGNASEVSFEVSGVSDELRANVRSHLEAFSIGRQSDASEKDFDGILSDAIEKAGAALRPFGYYRPEVKGSIRTKDDGDIVVRIDVDVGPPLLVDEVNIRVTGDGSEIASLREWQATWPLSKGSIVDQQVWEERKQFAIDAAEKDGYLGAEFLVHQIDVDLESYRATISLTLDTGDLFVFGNIEFGEHILKPGIVEYIQRFEEGDPYNRRLLDKFRVDLWKAGYFTGVDVEEFERPDASPPVVDLKVQLETSTRNTYQGSVGVGSDTGTRLQAQWDRHPISRNGDKLDVGIGWQEQDNEYSLRSTYRLPRSHRAREYWIGDLIIKHESIDLDVRRSADEDFIRIAKGSSDERHLRVGRLHVRNFKLGEQQAFETLFVQGLSASSALTPLETVPDLLALAGSPEAQRLLKSTDKTISVGFDYDLVAVNGKSWETKGHRERGWIFASSKSFGSDRDFLQAYVSTRRSYLKGDRWKVIVRAEAGYSDSKVSEYDIDVGSESMRLSVTDLPGFYRFRAGGTNSVRGYGFEELSDNHIGSNNIFSASAEVEMKFLDDWSAALFIDIGNAFNDWSNPEMKKGVGVGLRWYSIAGPIRVDVAQALDLTDRPWRIHFNIGTPLL